MNPKILAKIMFADLTRAKIPEWLFNSLRRFIVERNDWQLRALNAARFGCHMTDTLSVQVISILPLMH
jgi:hypothetical protein